MCMHQNRHLGKLVTRPKALGSKWLSCSSFRCWSDHLLVEWREETCVSFDFSDTVAVLVRASLVLLLFFEHSAEIRTVAYTLLQCERRGCHIYGLLAFGFLLDEHVLAFKEQGMPFDQCQLWAYVSGCGDVPRVNKTDVESHDEMGVLSAVLELSVPRGTCLLPCLPKAAGLYFALSTV